MKDDKGTVEKPTVVGSSVGDGGSGGDTNSKGKSKEDPKDSKSDIGGTTEDDDVEEATAVKGKDEKTATKNSTNSAKDGVKELNDKNNKTKNSTDAKAKEEETDDALSLGQIPKIDTNITKTRVDQLQTLHTVIIVHKSILYCIVLILSLLF